MPSHWNIQWKFVIITSVYRTADAQIVCSWALSCPAHSPSLRYLSCSSPPFSFCFFSSSLFVKTPFGIKSALLSVTQLGTLITFSVIPYTAFSLQQYFLNELFLSFIFSLSLCCGGGASPSYLGVVRGFFFLLGSGFKGMWGLPEEQQIPAGLLTGYLLLSRLHEDVCTDSALLVLSIDTSLCHCS